MAVQAFEPIEFGQLVFGVCSKSAKCFEETVACVVLVPSGVRLFQSLEQSFLFPHVPLRVWLVRQMFRLRQDNFKLADLVNKVLCVSVTLPDR